MSRLLKWAIIIGVIYLIIRACSGNSHKPTPIDDDKDIPFHDAMYEEAMSGRNVEKILWQSVNRDGHVVLLKAGTEKWGLKHILCRHSVDYCKDYPDKGSPFNPRTTSRQLTEGLEYVVKNGYYVYQSHEKQERIIRYDAHTTINGLDAVYTLVFRASDGRIITFFPRL